VGHYIADCPQLKNKEKEKRYKEKSKDYKKKYRDHAHVGQEWESSHKDSNHEGMATLAMPKSSRKSSTTSSMMKMTLLFVSLQEGLRYKNYPSPPPIFVRPGATELGT
jgi:hypothetical protein